MRRWVIVFAWLAMLLVPVGVLVLRHVVDLSSQPETRYTPTAVTLHSLADHVADLLEYSRDVAPVAVVPEGGTRPTARFEVHWRKEAGISAPTLPTDLADSVDELARQWGGPEQAGKQFNLTHGFGGPEGSWLLDGVYDGSNGRHSFKGYITHRDTFLDVYAPYWFQANVESSSLQQLLSRPEMRSVTLAIEDHRTGKMTTLWKGRDTTLWSSDNAYRAYAPFAGIPDAGVVVISAPPDELEFVWLADRLTGITLVVWLMAAVLMLIDRQYRKAKINVAHSI